jgi:hypothetical protein
VSQVKEQLQKANAKLEMAHAQSTVPDATSGALVAKIECQDRAIAEFRRQLQQARTEQDDKVRECHKMLLQLAGEGLISDSTPKPEVEGKQGNHQAAHQMHQGGKEEIHDHAWRKRFAPGSNQGSSLVLLDSQTSGCVISFFSKTCLHHKRLLKYFMPCK